jgi:hypothetical protein
VLDINALYDAGIKSMADEHELKEADKKGILRAGNTGIIMDGGKVAGPCARTTLLRFEGIRYDTVEDSKRLMFDAGLSNEDIWVKSLETGIKALGESLVVKREEEVPIKWTTPSGVTVTGRPDIVLGRMEGEEFKPVVGLELKLVSSVWTGRDTGVMLEPKLVHLMQAGHYSWQLGVPFQLWYTNRAEFAVGSGWEQRTFPPKDNLLTNVLEFGESKGKVTVKKLLQFRQGYELEWTKGKQLKYRPILADKQLDWTWTPITQQGIVDYYEAVVEQKSKQKLAPRPSTLKADGSPGTFNNCDYCPLQATCDKLESDYKKWLDAVSSLYS